MSIWRIAPCGVVFALIGCSSVGSLQSGPTDGVDLSGSWSLDRSSSDDPKPVIEKLRPKPSRYRSDEEGLSEDTGPVTQQPGGDQQGQRGGSGRRGQQMPMNAAPRNDTFPRMQVMKMLMADIARADQLTISQSPDRFSIDYGSQIRSFTPGAVSVVSADWGVADQSSGWTGREYVIEVKPQAGVASVEKFGLSADGKHLIEQLRLGGRDFPTVELKRTYDRSDKPPARGVPTND